ncbi:MAG: DUF1559 domain-containing protein [Planctomycetota bacterium]
MPYLYTCPHCSTRTQVDDEFSGQSGECVVCNKPIALPDFAPALRHTKSRRLPPAAWVAAAVVLLLIVGAGMIAVIQVGGNTAQRLREGRIRLSSTRNLETIAKAFRAYAADHGHFPPAFSEDATGRKLHSWRVLLLPYLGEEELHERFNLSQPWDSRQNMQVAREGLPSVFRHPESVGWGLETHYFLILGEGTLYPPSGPLRPDQIRDGSEKTILITEAMAPLSSGSWTEPVDLDAGKIAGGINVNQGQDLGGITTGGACVVTADGRGHFLAESTPPLTVSALITPRGGEPLPDDVLD